MNIPENLPLAETEYLRKLVGIVSKNFDCIIGVYLFGSGAYGGYIKGKSDLDVQVVLKKSLTAEEKWKFVEITSNKKIPCPARKLELVCYPVAALNPVSKTPDFDINFNTGKYEPDHICFNPDNEPSHWFLLDIAIGRELGFNLIGPPPWNIFGKIHEKWVITAMIECISWYEQYESASVDLALNTCRCWCFAETKKMCSKKDGLLWAVQKPDSPDFLKKLSENYKQDTALTTDQTLNFIKMVKGILSGKIDAKQSV